MRVVKSRPSAPPESPKTQRVLSASFGGFAKQCRDRYVKTITDPFAPDTYDSFTALFLVLFGVAILLPTALGFWIMFYVFSENGESISPIRWFVSIVLPLYFSVWGFRRKSLSCTGAFTAFVIGFIITMSSYVFSTCLVVFFLLGSRATRMKANMKRDMEADYQEGGQRDWVQVLCNGGVATVCSFLYMLEAGCREKPINFGLSYYESSYALAVLGALSCSCGDTLASELGSVWSRHSPRLITSFRKVPRGTNGAISFTGLFMSCIGGVIIGGVFFFLTILSLSSHSVRANPPQWPVVLVGGLCGFIGSLVDSYLGAMFQFTGIDENRRIVNFSGDGIKRVSGLNILDNNCVNFLSVAFSAIIAPKLGLVIWSYV